MFHMLYSCISGVGVFQWKIISKFLQLHSLRQMCVAFTLAIFQQL